MTDRHKDTGISPAVGVILLIGLSVATATLAGIVLLDIGDRNLNDSVNAGVEISETPDGVEVSWDTQGNAEEIKVQVNGETVSTLGNVNDSITLGVSEGKTVSAVGVSQEGEQVINETNTENNTNSNEESNYTVKDQNIAGQTVTGTVTLNPPIEGASVKILDSQGQVLSSTTTDSQGKFSTVGNTGDEIKVVVDGDISYNGRDVYASKTQTVSSSDVTIDFDQSKLVAVGSSKSVVNNGSIGSAVEIQAIPDNSSKEYKLLSDIDASGSNTGDDFKPARDFSGVLDGNGYTISNLSLSKNADAELGLFETINGGTVKNVKFSNVTIDLKDGSSGVVAGKTTGSTLIENVEVSNSTINGYYSGGLVGITSGGTTITRSDAKDIDVNARYGGGLVGRHKGELTKSYSLQTDVNDDDSGLLVASLYGGSISNSYARGMISYTDDFGTEVTTAPLIGSAPFNSSNASNVYNTSGTLGVDSEKLSNGGYYKGKVRTDDAGERLGKYQMVEGTAEETMNGFDFESVWKKPNGDRYPTLQDNQEETQQSELSINETLYSCKDVSYSTNGSGALEINNATKLQCIDSKSSDTDYVLTSDIDASSINQFKQLKSYDAFTGELDGNGYTISNLSLSKNIEDRLGLFETINGGTVKNVKFSNVTIDLKDGSSGVVAGKTTGSTLIENVGVSNSTVNGYYSGGLVGITSSGTTITRSDAKDIDVNARYGGGLIGRHNGELTKSYSLQTDINDDDSGLLVASLYGGSISNSYARGMVSYTDSFGTEVTTAPLIGSAPFNSSNASNVYNTSGTLGVDSEKLSNGGYHSAKVRTDGASERLGKYQMVEGTAEKYMSGFDFGTVWELNGDRYPTLQDNQEETQQSELSINETLYSCKDISYSKNGSEALEINNATKLQCIDSKSSDTDYVLTSDIDASSINQFKQLKSYNAFTGELNGNGYTISNLSLSKNIEDRLGLFETINGGTVKNVKFSNVTIDLKDGSSGVVAGKTTGSTLIENVGVSNSTVNGYYSGGLVGITSGGTTITRSDAKDIDVNARYGGGLIGRHNGELTKSYSLQTDVNDDDSGLLVASLYRGSISNSYARGMVSYTDDFGTEVTTAPLIGSAPFNSSNASNVYNTSGTLGVDSEKLSNGYYNSDSVNSSAGTGLTTSEMQGSSASSNMTGFDFTSVWNIRSGDYPELQDNSE